MKATSINNIDNVDMNVSQEINNVLSEIEQSKNNEMPPQLPQMIPQQMPAPQQPLQQVPQQYAQDPNFNMPNYYKNFPTQSSGGVFDFLKSFMIVGNEFKFVGIIAALFFIMNMSQTKNMLGKYLKFTLNDLGDSTMVGIIARGLIVGLIFVLINKFM